MNNTLVKGLQLLEELADREEAVGVSELAVQLGMGKSNVHRTLQALVELGYVINEDGRGSYRASLKMWELGARMIARLDVRQAALPAMHWLLEETRETVHLSVLDGEQVMYVDKLDSPEPVRAYSEIGGRAPAYCVATGKVLLAWRERPQPSLHPVNSKREAFTPATITDAAEMTQELARIRTQGYAVNRGEWRASVWGVAAPITDGTGRVVAAIGVSGPATRIKPAGIRLLAKAVTEAARRIANTLAGHDAAVSGAE
ncbi:MULTISPECIES: IclR family transcriptional regulator [Polaromonas]|uniref:IclR family transcriptional regulator n=1 Tax=Polaromonas aquatica TaxID=332657 RepID=A0ABW1U1D9_9BURK